MVPIWILLSRAKDDGGGRDKWSRKMCKARVRLPPPTNQHPTLYRPDALTVAQPTVSKHWREKISHSMDLLTPSSPGGLPTLYFDHWRILVILVIGPHTWNQLPEEITSAASLSTFQCHLKTFLFRKSFPDIIAEWHFSGPCGNLNYLGHSKKFWLTDWLEDGCRASRQPSEWMSEWLAFNVPINTL